MFYQRTTRNSLTQSSFSAYAACPTVLCQRCPRLPHADTGWASQHCTGGVQEWGLPAVESGWRFHSWRAERLFKHFVSTISVMMPHHEPVTLYELSRASRTLMICCLMTLVASPALGIKYLRGMERTRDWHEIEEYSVQRITETSTVISGL